MTDLDVRDGRARPTLILMHFLGGSAKQWGAVTESLGPEYPWLGLDLPGFGDAAEIAAYPVGNMVEYLAEALEQTRPSRFVLVGHSMSGKVAMTAARWAADGDERFAGLEGLLLLASSPPGPEPMSDEKREEMLPGLDGPAQSRRIFAEEYIQKNVGRALTLEVFELAVADVLRANPAAWRAWLESGSREDWAEQTGVLDLPALVVCGEKDADLGAKAQREYVLPHLRGARLEEIAGAGHLLPMEAPEEIARLVRDFVQRLETTKAGEPIGPEYLRLLQSQRVSALTRQTLLGRMAEVGPGHIPLALSVQELSTLRAVAGRVVPQIKDGIDLAAEVDQRLASGTGKGWRYLDLPADLAAYQGGLAALDREASARFGRIFVELDDVQKDSLLSAVESQNLVNEPPNSGDKQESDEHPAKKELTGKQMLRWFDDLRAELASIYVSHPATLARMGYSGVADGARSESMTGFIELGMGKVESWEPQAITGSDLRR